MRLSYPAVTVTAVGRASAFTSNQTSTRVTRVGFARPTSTHWRSLGEYGADCQEVSGLPSIAAYGWCSGRAPPGESTCEREVDARIVLMPSKRATVDCCAPHSGR